MAENYTIGYELVKKSVSSGIFTMCPKYCFFGYFDEHCLKAAKLVQHF